MEYHKGKEVAVGPRKFGGGTLTVSPGSDVATFVVLKLTVWDTVGKGTRSHWSLFHTHVRTVGAT